MADTSIISPLVVRLGGGLVLDKDTFSIPPGSATTLENFEPDINGGYRSSPTSTLMVQIKLYL